VTDGRTSLLVCVFYESSIVPGNDWNQSGVIIGVEVTGYLSDLLSEASRASGVAGLDERLPERREA
jgi:hypothetical protein